MTLSVAEKDMTYFWTHPDFRIVGPIQGLSEAGLITAIYDASAQGGGRPPNDGGRLDQTPELRKSAKETRRSIVCVPTAYVRLGPSLAVFGIDQLFLVPSASAARAQE